MMGCSPQCHILTFMDIGPPVREKKNLKGFDIYGRGGHLGHVTQMPKSNLHSPYTRRLYIKFGFDRPSSFREEGA